MSFPARINREFKFLSRLLRTLGRIRKIDTRADWLACDELERAVDRWSDNEALRSEDGKLTYAQGEA